MAAAPQVFAAASHRRPRWVAVLGAGLGLVAILYSAVLVAAGLAGPDGPGLHLSEFERYDTVPISSTPPLIGDRGTSPWPLLIAGTVLAGVVAWLVFDRFRTRHRTRFAGTATALGSSDRQARRSASRTARRVARWWPALAGVVLLSLVVSLLAHQYTTAKVALDEHVDDGVLALPNGSGPVLEIRDDGVRSIRSPPGHVALTFDDGPDPRWTPAILDVLKEERVPGTFFVIGQHVVDHPEIARRAIREGSELGVHTYRHFEITTQAPSELNRDLRLTQLAIIGATGRSAALFRPPFITDRSNVGLHQYVALRQIAASGYITVLADRDSTDWSRPGANVIAIRSMPSFGAGAIIEMHDGGGDRSQTVAALRTVIQLLKAEGYQFDTVSEIARLSKARAMPSVGWFDRAWGRTFTIAVGSADAVVWWFLVLILIVGVATMARVGVVVVTALRSLRHTPRSVVGAANLPAATVIVAAYNEADSIAGTLAALSSARAGDLQIVVVDDGSTDATADLVRAFPDPRIELVSIAHAGKVAALTAGFARSTGTVIVTVDADTRVSADGITALLRPFADSSVGGVGGNLEVEKTDSVLSAAQHLEYVIGNAFDRRALSAMGTQATIPGAMGAFRRDALVAVGGFDGATIAEDTDLTLALVDAGWTLVFAPDARAETSAPTTVRGLWRQRSRWSFGIAQAAWRRRRMVRRPQDRPQARPRVGATWCFVVISQILLPIAAPLVDLAAVWGLATGSRFPLVLWSLMAVMQFGAAAIALRIEGQSLLGLWAFPFHLFGYRQVTSFVVLQTVAWAVVGRRPVWGANGMVVPADLAAPSEIASGPSAPTAEPAPAQTEPRPDQRAVPQAA